MILLTNVYILPNITTNVHTFKAVARTDSFETHFGSHKDNRSFFVLFKSFTLRYLVENQFNWISIRTFTKHPTLSLNSSLNSKEKFECFCKRYHRYPIELISIESGQTHYLYPYRLCTYNVLDRVHMIEMKHVILHAS